MLHRPKLKSCYRLEIADPETALLLHEAEPRILRGRLYAQVLPLLDGLRTVDEIADDLEGEASAAEVLYVIDLLAQRGHLVESDPETPEGTAAFWHALDVDTLSLATRLLERPISLRAVGGASAVPLEQPLASLGIKIAEPACLSVIATDDYLSADLDAENRRALTDGRPFMLVQLTGATSWIGPIFCPGKTGCWACLEQRLRRQRPLSATLERMRGIRGIRGIRGERGAPPLARAALPASVAAAANLAAIEIAKWLARSCSRLEGTMVTLDALRLELADHILVKRPQCPACGGGRAARTAAEVALTPRRKGFTADGGHRAVSPEETIATYGHHQSPITGILRPLARLSTGEEGVVFVYDAGPNLALTADSVEVLRETFRSRSGGKGKTAAQARASALCEALERYSGVFQGDEPRAHARMRDLGGAAIHPNACMLFSEAQYATRQVWNDPGRDLPQRVPEPFDPALLIDWSPVWSLTERVWKHLPTAYVYYGVPAPPEGRFCFADSNGAAAGTCLEEAILQGFLELVERDGVSLYWYNRLKRPGVDLSSFQEPYFEELIVAYMRLGRELWVLDLTSDLGIPTFAAVSRRTDGAREEITLGFGAHLEAPIAVLRALTESNQYLPLLRPGGPGGAASAGHTGDPWLHWMSKATIANQPYLVPDRVARPKVAADYPSLASDDLAEDVRRCVALAARHGLETLVLDQTRPDIGLPVVKVVVPGLRHFWRRLGPGRLYEVPVRMGWLGAPLAEGELNPMPVFF